MRHLYCSLLLIFLCAKHCFSQELRSGSFYIDKIPAHGLLLDKGWKFKAGDHPEYAKPGFNDSAWEPVNPALDIHDSLPQVRSGICWFRLHLWLDSTIESQQLALVIQQSGSSEIFMDGLLIKRFGVVDKNPAQVRAYDPLDKPFQFSPKKLGHHVIAVRYAVQPKVLYTKIFETTNPALHISINTLTAATHKYEWYIFVSLAYSLFVIGVFGLAFILHLSYYVFNPQQKANLSFTIFSLFFMAEHIIRIWIFLNSHDPASRFYLYNLCSALLSGSDLLLLTAIHQLSGQKRDLVYKILFAFFAISTLFIVPQYGWGWIVGGVIAGLATKLGIMRIAFTSVQKRRRGAWIIAWGTISCFVFFIIFLVAGIFGKDLFNLGAFRIVFYTISVLSIPISTSIYLGLDFAFLNRALSKKLSEVEELSQKTIFQEKEKQQILASQKQMLENEVKQRTAALHNSLEELKSTQSQLIQSEKMASLGELTAGIAHEIQNPLNFVNNFSEVNRELLAELQEEMKKGNIDEANAIAGDIIANEEKINHHGKRADAIVKGMLQHSRGGNGVKEPTDINSLADEYLRMSYHGLRSKNKSFNAVLNTDFDATLKKINIVPQDIGRVLLNLYTNAFYALDEKKRQHPETYEPQIWVTTRKVQGNNGDRVEITVRDNGVGIPQHLKEKIYQPFFTTKPAGKGTGLGLSLSYDIVKAHSGEIRMDPTVKEGALFTISLPVE